MSAENANTPREKSFMGVLDVATKNKASWDDIADAIHDAISMEDVLTAYANSTPRRNHRCPCPIHNGDDYNFSYSNQYYKCFVCGASGDTISFVKEICGLQSMSDAMKKINADFDLKLPIDCNLNPVQSAEVAARRAEREMKRREELMGEALTEKEERIKNNMKILQRRKKEIDEWLNDKKQRLEYL